MSKEASSATSIKIGSGAVRGHACGTDSEEIRKVNYEDRKQIIKSVSREKHISLMDAAILVTEVYLGIMV